MRDWIEAKPDQLPPEHPVPGMFYRCIVYVPDLDRGTIDENGVTVGWYCHQTQLWYLQGSPSTWTVTHWIPMPQPPGDENEEEEPEYPCCRKCSVDGCKCQRYERQTPGGTP